MALACKSLGMCEQGQGLAHSKRCPRSSLLFSFHVEEIRPSDGVDRGGGLWPHRCRRLSPAGVDSACYSMGPYCVSVE